MEQNERKNRNIIFVEPEMVEDMPLSRMERIREGARNIRHRMGRVRFHGVGPALMLASVALALLVLIALPVAAAVMLAVSCLRSAFRAQTA